MASIRRYYRVTDALRPVYVHPGGSRYDVG